MLTFRQYQNILLHVFQFLQDLLIAAFGFIFFLSIGAKIIDTWRHGISGCAKKGKAVGSLSVIASFLYLADTAFGGFAVIKS